MTNFPKAVVRRISVWDLAVERAKVFLETHREIKNPGETEDRLLERVAANFGVDPVKLKKAVKQ